MKAAIYLLMGIAALALSACGSENRVSQQADPVKLAQYKKGIARKWRFDVPYMERQMKIYLDSGYRRAYADVGNSAVTVYGMMEGYLTNFQRDVKSTVYEFSADGTRREKHLHFRQPYEGRYDFDSGLDTLYFRSKDGKIEEKYPIVSVSDTALLFKRASILSSDSPDHPVFYWLPCKMVPAE